MKTFTVTIHHTTNYGAVLQTYALQQSILSMGYENEVFEFDENVENASSSIIKKMISNPINGAKFLVGKLLKLRNIKAINRRKNAFENFRSSHLKLSKTYYSMDELRKNPPDADILFTGSDQVWRFKEDNEFTEAYFLDFGKDNVKKYSYAASIEKLNYSNEQIEKVKWLRDFNGIALREQTAAEYIHNITGYPTCRVLDPVFLLKKEQWLKIARKREIQEPYIFCYQVQSSPRMQEIVDDLRKKTGYRTVAVLPYNIKWIKTDYAYYDVSPEEFLYLISKAEIVVSASFHGVALGLEFDKVVYATARDNYNKRIKI